MRPVQISLRVLEAVGSLQPIGVSELARDLQLPKSTVQRALASIAEAGWIQPQDPVHSKWSLTPKALVAFGRAMQAEHRLRSAALPVMEQLRRESGETVFLAIRHERWIVLVERLDGMKPLYNYWPIGSRTRMHTVSLGKAILAHLSEPEIEDYLAGGLPPRTAFTTVDPDALREELRVARELGYAVALRSNWATENAVGAPVYRAHGAAFAAISISAPIERMSIQELKRWGPTLADAARRISFGLQENWIASRAAG